VLVLPSELSKKGLILTTLFGILAQAQPSQPPASASPELLTALGDLIKITTEHPSAIRSGTWLTPEGIRAAASLFSAIAWPALIVFLVLAFRRPLIDLIPGVTEFEFFGVKGKIINQLNRSAEIAEKSEGLSPAPTPGELERAVQVERLTGKADLSFVRQQIDQLAAEYERVRASMRASDTRTRAMEVVVSKMRTIGRAAYPLRHELSVSPSPGHRLQAIASLQVIPDYDDLIDWLIDRLDLERPFVSYHALVALNAAAADQRAPAYLPVLERALSRAKEKTAAIGRDTDRQKLLKQFEVKIEALRNAIEASMPASTAAFTSET
jgi:hypothetical protein